MLAPDELTIGDVLATAGHNSIDNGQSGDRDLQLCCGQPEQRLMGVGGHLAKVVHSGDEAGGVAAVGCLVRIAHEEGDRLRTDAQLFGDDLCVISTHSGTGFRPARTHVDGVVGSDLQP